MAERSCLKCEFFQMFDYESVEQLSEEQRTDHYLSGECRRLPPVVHLNPSRMNDPAYEPEANYPIVLANHDWCGEFRPHS